MKNNSSFAKNLSIKIILVASALLFIVIVILGASATVSTVENCHEKMNTQMKMASRQIETELSIIESLAKNAIKTVEWMSLSNTEQFLKAFVSSNPHITSASLCLNPEKTLQSLLILPIASKDTAASGGVLYLPCVSELAYKIFMEEFHQYRNQHEGADMLLYQDQWFGPYRNEAGKFEFSFFTGTDKDYPENDILEAAISMDWLSDFLDDVKPYDNTEAFIMDDKKNILCSTSQASTLSVFGKFGFNVKMEDSYLDKYKTLKAFDVDWDEKCIIGKEIMNNGWTLIVKCPLAVVFSDVLKYILNMVLLMVISVFLIFLFCSRIIFRKARPLVEFADASGYIAQGNFDTALPVINENDEISRLRDAFANMQVSLKEYISNLANVTAMKQRMESELNIAKDIQHQALHRVFPANERYDLYASMNAAKEVGGDLYDFVQKGNKLYICIGDVSGKGVPAALLMMTTTMIFRHVCTSSERSMSEMTSIINNCVADGNDTGFFVTTFLACIDLDTMEMKYCNGGHNDILVITPEGKASFNKAKTNIVCGVFSDFPFVEESIQLKHGSRVILYTDGVNEAMNCNNEEFGNDRLLEWANNCSRFSDEKSLVEDLNSTVKKFTADAEQSDDITMLSVRIS